MLITKLCAHDLSHAHANLVLRHGRYVPTKRILIVSRALQRWLDHSKCSSFLALPALLRRVVNLVMSASLKGEWSSDTPNALHFQLRNKQRTCRNQPHLWRLCRCTWLLHLPVATLPRRLELEWQLPSIALLNGPALHICNKVWFVCWRARPNGILIVVFKQLISCAFVVTAIINMPIIDHLRIQCWAYAWTVLFSEYLDLAKRPPSESMFQCILAFYGMLTC